MAEFLFNAAEKIFIGFPFQYFFQIEEKKSRSGYALVIDMGFVFRLDICYVRLAIKKYIGHSDA